MKKLLLLSASFLFFCTAHYGQIDSFRTKQIDVDLHQHYMQKSKNQLRTGLILLGSGVVLNGIAIATFPDSYDPFFGTNSSKTESQANVAVGLFIVGSAALISSIPVLISSAVNKHKARLLVNSERVELSPQIKTSEWQLKTGIAINF
jgi:hypothetical protein